MQSGVNLGSLPHSVIQGLKLMKTLPFSTCGFQDQRAYFHSIGGREEMQGGASERFYVPDLEDILFPLTNC